MRNHICIGSPFDEVYPSFVGVFGRKRMSFFLDGQPPNVTAQQKGERVVRGKIIHYEKEKVAEAREWIDKRLEPNVPPSPFSGAVCMELFWVSRWLEKHLRANGTKKPALENKRLLLNPNRPDSDNLSKLFCDCLTARKFVKDDSQIAISIFLKAWGDDPGVAVRLTEVE